MQWEVSFRIHILMSENFIYGFQSLQKYTFWCIYCLVEKQSKTAIFRKKSKGTTYGFDQKTHFFSSIRLSICIFTGFRLKSISIGGFLKKHVFSLFFDKFWDLRFLTIFDNFFGVLQISTYGVKFEKFHKKKQH